jgi:hypothetical protein
MVDSSEIIIYLSVSFIPLGRVLYCCKEYWAGVRSGGRGAGSRAACSCARVSGTGMFVLYICVSSVAQKYYIYYPWIVLTNT